MQAEAPTLTFDQVLETVTQWSFEQQEMLFEVLRRRQITLRRQEIAQNVSDAVAAFRRGELKPENASDAIARLRASLTAEV